MSQRYMVADGACREASKDITYLAVRLFVHIVAAVGKRSIARGNFRGTDRAGPLQCDAGLIRATITSADWR